MAPAKVPVTSLVDWLDAGAQATVAVEVISFVSIHRPSWSGESA